MVQRVQGRKNYQALADYLREQILSGSIPEGSPLPNERDLGGQAGLSRGSVREALRVLEVEGLVSTRVGRNGGSTTQRPDSAGVSRSLTAFIRGQQIPFDAVLETREVLEPALAALAADKARFIAANSRWHWAVAQASGNPLLVAMVAAVGDLLDRSNVERFVSAEVRDAVIRAHGGVEAAIRLRDADAAHRRMLRHIRTYRRQVAPQAPGSIDIREPKGPAP